MSGLRVVFLTGSSSASARDAIDGICQLPGVQPVGILFDKGHVPLKRRFRNFRNNIRRDGFAYPFLRILGVIRRITDVLVSRTAVPASEVQEILRRAFPQRCFSHEDLARRYSLELASVTDLNSETAVSILRSLNADLGIVLGTRVLRRNIFSVPRLGCINLHKGRVPEYRGLPPGFWELYDGATSAGVTVHFVNSGLDTGDVIARSEIPIDPLDTPDTLSAKLDHEGNRVLMDAVQSIQRGTVIRKPQPPSSAAARTKPSRAAVAAVQRRLPHWKVRGDLATITKNVYSLAVYWSGVYAAVRRWHRTKGNRAAILLFHRVNDYAGDILTTDTESFAAQLLALGKRYPIVETDSLVDAVAGKKPFPATSIAVHFDDCYRDVLTNAAPILKTLNVSATFFVNSGFVDTDRRFDHDRILSPFRFGNLSSNELRSLPEHNITVGAHTVNHVDLGTCAVQDAETEIADCGRELSQILGKPVRLFSFPFGGRNNIRKETADIVVRSRYEALFSAYGGFVNASTSVWDIPRSGVSSDTRPLFLLIEVEGLAPSQIRRPF